MHVIPQVIIQTPPPPKSAPSIDFYALLKRAVKWDSNNAIVAVLQYPPFMQAIVGFCKTARVFPGTPAARARYLGSIGWKGLVDKLSTTLRLLDHSAADNSPAVKAWFTFADAIITIDALHKPGSDVALALLTQVDTTLEAVQLAEDGDQVPHAKLQKHRDTVDQATQRQLYLLDIALQTFCAILDWHACLDKALGLTKVDHMGSLLDVLNVSFDMHSPTPFLLLAISRILLVQQR
ncbi:hypothetical protein C0993_008789, partial [Termitomyces sp. T159_Od127]